MDNKKIRLAVISTNYPSKNKSKFIFVHARVREYLKNNIEVRVFTRKEFGVDRYEYEGVEVSCGGIFKTLKNIKEYNPDLIIDHAPNPRFSSYLHVLLGRKFKIISWIHGNDVMSYVEGENRFLSFGKIIINSFCLRFDTKQVAVSEWMKSIAVKDCFLPADKIEIIPNIVDEKKFSITKRSFAGKTLRIISLRDLAQKYGIDIGINALNDISIPFHWDVYGIGYDQKYVKYLEKSVHNKNIHINKKRFPHDQIPKLYEKYDLFLAPSIHEAQGVAMLEAMMTGMPVVTTNIGGIPEFVDSSCGFLSKPEVKPIKDNIIKFYNLSIAQKKKMSDKARKKAVSTSSYDKTLSKEIALIKITVKK